MTDSPDRQRLAERYEEAADTFHVLTRTLLIEFAKHGSGIRDSICQNFIARADVMLSGIFCLWKAKDYGDCWIIHRALLDRLFHLSALNKDDHFDLFDEWSFKRQYDAINRVRSDPAIRGQLEGVIQEPRATDKARYQRLSRNPPQWHRPDPEQVARALGVSSLYKYGYDYASTYVHPMASDGQEDFYRITGLEPAPPFPDWTSVLCNSIIVATLILQEAMNASNVSWHVRAYDAILGIRRFLETASLACFIPALEVGQMLAAGIPLARRIGASDASHVME